MPALSVALDKPYLSDLACLRAFLAAARQPLPADEAEKETAFLMGRLRDVTPDNYVKKKEGLVPKHPGTFQPLMPEALRPNTDNLLRYH